MPGITLCRQNFLTYSFKSICVVLKTQMRSYQVNETITIKLACVAAITEKGQPARNPMLCRIYSFSQRTRNLIGSK